MKIKLVAIFLVIAVVVGGITWVAVKMAAEEPTPVSWQDSPRIAFWMSGVSDAQTAARRDLRTWLQDCDSGSKVPAFGSAFNDRLNRMPVFDYQYFDDNLTAMEKLAEASIRIALRGRNWDWNSTVSTRGNGFERRETRPRAKDGTRCGRASRYTTGKRMFWWRDYM